MSYQSTNLVQSMTYEAPGHGLYVYCLACVTHRAQASNDIDYLHYLHVENCLHLCWCYKAWVVGLSSLHQVHIDSCSLEEIPNYTLYLIYGDKLF